MPDSVSLARLQELLGYDPLTGIFRWKRGHARQRDGDIAGSDVRGYLNISIDGQKVRAHRLAWLYVNGAYPPGQIDHINGVRSDNRIANLRIATMSQNAANQRRRSDNTTGFKGVAFNTRKTGYVAYVDKDGKRHRLGRFETAEAAYEAYCEGAKRLFGEFANSGFGPIQGDRA